MILHRTAQGDLHTRARPRDQQTWTVDPGSDGPSLNPRGAFGLMRANGQKIWAAHLEMDVPQRATSRELGTVRPTTERCGREFARRVAGEGRRGDAGKWSKRVRNSIAHPTMAGTSPEMGYSGGATRRSGGATTGNMATAIGHRPPRVGACISTRETLGTYWDDPELKRWPELSWRRRGGETTGNYGHGVTATPAKI